jgi:heme a synthase
MTKFQAYAAFTTLLTFGVVILGGVVRVTDSGLGCPDWPRCHGSFIPPAQTEIWIEWSHRLAASVVGFLILVLAVAAWRTQRQNPVVIGAAAASLVVLVVQVVLGAITVREELPAEVVATHLVTGLALLSTLIVLTISSFSEAADFRPSFSPTVTFLAMTMALALGVMWLGAYMTESGANFACDGWPRCNGSFLPEFTSLVRTHWLHRALAALLGVALVLLAVQQRTLHDRSVLFSIAQFVLALYVVQVLVGAGNIWTDMSDATSITHLILSSTIWAALVSMLTLTLYAPTQRAAEDAKPASLAKVRA